ASLGHGVLPAGSDGYSAGIARCLQTDRQRAEVLIGRIRDPMVHAAWSEMLRERGAEFVLRTFVEYAPEQQRRHEGAVSELAERASGVERRVWKQEVERR